MKEFCTLLFLLVVADALALSVDTYSYPEVCGYANGRAGVNVFGGVPPYTVSWDNGGSGTQISGLTAGTYVATVVDNVGTQVIANVTVGAANGLQVGLYTSLPTCPGQCTGTVAFDIAYLGGVAPYNFSIPPFSQDANAVTWTGACWYPEAEQVTITDQNGCAVTTPIGTMNAYSAQVSFVQLMPSCQGSDGHVIFTLDYVQFTTLRVYDAQMNQVYADPDPPSSLPIQVGGLAPGDYFIRCITEEIPGEWCYNEYTFTIQDLGTDCGRAMGDLYIDVDGDCFFDVMEETGMPYRILTVEPGPSYGITDANGHYMVNLDAGSYTIACNDADLFPICPAIEPVPFDITLIAPVVIQDLADSSAQGPDLELTCAYSEARPGFVFHAWLTIKNLSPYWAYPDLVFNYDPLLTFISSDVGGGTLTPGQITWANFPFITGFGTRIVHLQFQVPADVGLIGTQLTSTGFVQQNPPEIDNANNSCTESVTVVGSFDPNDKTATTSTGLSSELYFIDLDSSITYVIRFQNTGTASAINVEVSDTLAPELDPGTIHLLGWSHQLDRVAITPGPVMHWYFDNINLPDSGANEAASHGFVSFSIKPRQPVLPGTVIENTASIFFDFNAAVITEPSILTAEFSTDVVDDAVADLLLAPVPASDHLRISSRAMIENVTIISTDGRSILQQSVRSASATLDVTTLTSGAYFLIASNADGSMQRASFTVINH